MMGPGLLLAFVVLGEVNGFLISLVQPEFISLNPGGSFTLTCGTDSSYEHCDWKHPGGTKACNFEWKRAVGAVQMQECEELSHRVVFVGDYNKHQCGIRVSNAELSDSGPWTCEIEQYVWGDWASGTKVAATMNVSVVASTVAPPTSAYRPTPSTRVTPVSSTTNSAVVTSAPPTKLTTPMTTQKQPEPTSSSSSSSTAEEQPTTEGEVEAEVEPEPSVVPEPVPHTEETEESSTATPVVVGILVVLVVIGVLVGGVFYYRKRNAANGAVHYKPDPNDDKVTLQQQESNISVNSNSSSNLHEYHPPSFTYNSTSTSTPHSNA